MSAILTTMFVMSVVAYVVGVSDPEEGKLHKAVKLIAKMYCCCLAFVFITVVAFAGLIMWLALLLLE